MKKLLLVIFTFIVFIASSQKQNLTKEDWKLIKSTAKGLRVEPDFFNNVIWVKTKDIAFMGMTKPSSMGGSTRVHRFYFGVKKDTTGKFYLTAVRYVFNYKAASWIFADDLQLIVSESNNDTRVGLGNKYKIDLTEDKSPIRDVKGNGLIEEQYDVSQSVDIFKWLKEVAETGHYTRIRANGSKGYEEFVLRGSDLKDDANDLITAMINIGKL